MGRPLRGLALAAALLLPGGVHGQSIRPLIAEFDEPTTGSFEVQNPSLFPVTVVVEPWTFELDPDGRAVFTPLPEGVDVRFSETSFRVPPRSGHTVHYQVRAERAPAWFTIYATIVGPRQQTADGLRLRLRLPHTVYVYGEPLPEEDVRVSDVRLDREAGEVVALIENVGSRLGRVERVEARADGARSESPGFPLLPGGSRSVRLPWRPDAGPPRLVFHFDDFEIVVPDASGAAGRAGR